MDENYYNIQKILNMLDIQSLGPNLLISVDIKLMLILLGKQSAASVHSCPYCECWGQFSCPCPANTLGSLKAHHQRFVEDGQRKASARNYNNCTQPALLSGPDDTTILQLLGFPELHAMMGATGKLVTELIKTFPDKEQGQKFVNTFMAKNNISWCAYQPGTFEGNQARKFLRKSAELEKEARLLPLSSAIPAIAFSRTLRSLDKVVEACFGQELEQNFENDIRKFEELYRMLDISVTPKMHLIFVHAAEFLKLKGLVAGLGAYSEQAMESAHHNFKKEWERSKVGPNHPKYDDQVLSSILRFNAKHM